MRLAYKWAATLVGVLGLFMAVLDNTIVNVALPAMQTAFHTDRSTITWVVTGYFLAQAAVIPITGYLSDRFGTRLVFLIALSLFTVGSAICSFAPNETFLIVARLVQGIGGGALFPVVFAIVYRVFTPDERGPATAVIGVPILLAPAFGPTVGGYLTTTFNWNAIFLINVPLGIIGLVLAWRILRDHKTEIALGDEVPAGKSFDIPGLVLSLVGVTSLVYGISLAGETITTGVGAAATQHARGWTDPQVAIFLIIGLVLLVIFVLLELRSNDPVMDMRLFKNYTFTIANVLTWALSAVLLGALFLLPIFFETVQGKTPLQTGLILIPQGLASAVGVAIAGRLYNVTGPRPLLIIGLVFTVIGSFGLTDLSVNTNSGSLQIWLALRGLGFGMANIPLQTLAVSTISNRAMARASSLVNVTRQIFSAVGITLLTTYLIQQTTNHVNAVKVDYTKIAPAVQQACAKQFGGNATAIQNCVQQHAQGYITAHATTLGLNNTFTLTLIGSALCIILAFFAGRDPNVERLKAAARRGEKIEPQARAMVAGE